MIPDKSAQPSLPILPLWFVILIGAAVLLSGTHVLPLLDRDEPRFSRATVEMMERGDWVIPYFNGEYRFDKPPLTYWWMAIHHKIMGVSELSCRLHAVEATLLIAVWMFIRGRRWVGQVGASWGTLAWCINVQIWQHGRLALADMPMILGLCLAMDGLWTCLQGEAEEKKMGFWLLLGGLSLGFLAKGPIVIAIPLLAVIAFLCMKDISWKDLNTTRWLLGVSLFLIVIGSWGIPALIKTQGLFAKVGLGEHVVERGVSAFNSRRYTPFFYLGTFFLSFFPWWLKGKSLIGFCRNHFKEKAVRFLLIWAIAPVIIFTFYSTQLPHYILPGFPALFLLLGAAISSVNVQKSIPWGTIAASIALIGLWVFRDKIVDNNFPMEFVPWLAIVLAGFAWFPFLSTRFHLKGIAVGAVILSVGTWNISHEFANQHLTLKIREATKVFPDQKLVRQSSTFGEPSLVFYLGGPWKFGDAIEDSNEGLRVERISKVEELGLELNGIKVKGFNPGKGQLEEVMIFPPQPSNAASMSER